MISLNIEVQVMSDEIGIQPQIGWNITNDPNKIFVHEGGNGWMTGMMIVQKGSKRNIIDLR